MAQSNDDRQSKGNGKLSAADLGQAALTTVEELTGYEPEAVTALTWDGDFWQITVDVLELARIPNTTDVLGSYVVQLDQGGTLHGYRRARRFVRGQPGEE
jgi:Gas vesicle synthesis protein GvpO